MSPRSKRIHKSEKEGVEMRAVDMLLRGRCGGKHGTNEKKGSKHRGVKGAKTAIQS